MNIYWLSPTTTGKLVVSVLLVVVTVAVVVISSESSRVHSLLVAASSTVSSQPCFFFIFGSGSFTTSPTRGSSAKTRRGTSTAFLIIPPTHAICTSRSMNPYVSFKNQHNKIWSISDSNNNHNNSNNKDAAKKSKNARGLFCTTTSTTNDCSKTRLYCHPLQGHFHKNNNHGGYSFTAGSQNKNYQQHKHQRYNRLATTSSLSARSRSACFGVGHTNQRIRINPQVNNDFKNAPFSRHALQNNNEDHISSSSSSSSSTSRIITSNYQSRNKYSNLAKQFQTHGIIYKTSILSMEEFRLIQQEMSSLPLKLVKEKSSSVAHHRIGAQLPPDCNTVKILSNPNGTMSRVVNELVQGLVMGADTSEYPSLLGDHTELETLERGWSSHGETSSSSLYSCSPSMKLSPLVPVEVRIYQQRGAGMELHYDDILFSPEQIEVVFTVENNSNCVTKWEEETTTQQSQLPSQQQLQQQQQQQNGKGDNTSMVEYLREEGGGGEERQAIMENKSAEKNAVTTTTWKQVETEPNSAIILRAGPKGARHSVSSLKTGKRVILKFVFVTQDAVFLKDQQHHAQQFKSASGKAAINKKKNKRNSKPSKRRGE